MDMSDIAIQLQEIKDRSLRNEGRIKKLEGEHEVLHDLAKAVAVMAERVGNMDRSVNALTNKVEALEEEPAKKWRELVSKVAGCVVAAIVGFVLAQVGL